MTAQQDASPTPPAPPSPLVGAVILAIFVAAAVGYVLLNLKLGMTDFWTGFLFVTFWMCSEQVKPGAFTYCALGAIVGTLLALGLQMLPPTYGMAGLIAAYVLIVAAIYLQIIGKLHLIINFSTMIFLTVGAAVPMQAHVKILNVLPVLALGIVYWGAIFFGGQKLATLFTPRKEEPAAA